MKRVLVVDDERPVVDHIVRTIGKDLASEFLVAGTASSGREALEKVPVLQPDIVLMDVRMPGLSGLDTIRELKRQGSGAAFLLSTAYERFDIAKEALELGISGYMLKPVVKDSLAAALRTAAEQLDRRSGFQKDEVEQREIAGELRAFVARAYVDGLMLGRSQGEAVQAMRQWLAIDKPWGLLGAAVFLHVPEESHRELEALLQYKSNAICGPLTSDLCLIFQPLANAAEAPEAEKNLLDAVRSKMGSSLQRGALRMGFAAPRPIEEVAAAWPEALMKVISLRRNFPPSSGPLVGSSESEEAFHSAVLEGDPTRIRRAFEDLLAPFELTNQVEVPDRYSIISLLGGALRRLISRGSLDPDSASLWMDFDDLRQAADGQEFCLLARTRLMILTDAVGRSKRWSVRLASALDYVARNFAQPITLNEVALHVGLPAKRLSRMFIEEVGCGYSDYLIDLRISKAKIFLLLPGATIKQVSTDCGFSDPNYFSRLFKKVTGSTPTEFAAAR